MIAQVVSEGQWPEPCIGTSHVYVYLRGGSIGQRNLASPDMRHFVLQMTKCFVYKVEPLTALQKECLFHYLCRCNHRQSSLCFVQRCCLKRHIYCRYLAYACYGGAVLVNKSEPRNCLGNCFYCHGQTPRGPCCCCSGSEGDGKWGRPTKGSLFSIGRTKYVNLMLICCYEAK